MLIVIPKRFERLTHALEGRCSIQLSYGTSLICGCKGSAFYENSKTFWNFFIHIFLWCYESVFYERSFFYLIRWGLNSCFIDKQMNSIFFGKLIKGEIWKNSCDSIFDFIPCCPSQNIKYPSIHFLVVYYIYLIKVVTQTVCVSPL